MHPMLPLTIEHVVKLHKYGVTSLNHAKAVVEEAVKKNRAKKLYPELSEKAGLCQRVLVNNDTFKVMIRWYMNSLKIGPKSHNGADHVAGLSPAKKNIFKE